MSAPVPTLIETIYQGKAWAIDTITVTEDDEETPISLAGATASLTLRSPSNAKAAAITLTHSSGITLGGAAGTIDLGLTSVQTAALAPGTVLTGVLFIDDDPYLKIEATVERP